SCPKLQSYWHFHDCGYRKIAGTCNEPDHFPACPLPLHPLRNGRLNQTAYGLFLFIRDLADGDLVAWISELADPKPAPSLPRSWDDIEIGHFVLGTEGPGEGYWEAIVLGRDNDMLTLKWIDYPDDPQLVCHRTAVALLKPSAADPSTAA